jgi:hypothetical protein
VEQKTNPHRIYCTWSLDIILQTIYWIPTIQKIDPIPEFRFHEQIAEEGLFILVVRKLQFTFVAGRWSRIRSGKYSKRWMLIIPRCNSLTYEETLNSSGLCLLIGHCFVGLFSKLLPFLEQAKVVFTGNLQWCPQSGVKRKSMRNARTFNQIEDILLIMQICTARLDLVHKRISQYHLPQKKRKDGPAIRLID